MLNFLSHFLFGRTHHLQSFISLCTDTLSQCLLHLKFAIKENPSAFKIQQSLSHSSPC